MNYSIVIATYNRAPLLHETLQSLAGLQVKGSWEAIVVDNNSTDNTRAVVSDAAATFPVPLRYAFERQQGRSAALNCGFALAEGDIIVTTDDDVRVGTDWLDRIAAGLQAHACDYIAGKVVPLWEVPPPRWFPDVDGALWGVVALVDLGDVPMPLGRRVPLGVNMAFRREVLDRVGGFDPAIGRKAGTLLGQEVREWCLRARAAGLTGFYLPDVVVQHLIPRARLSKWYFRRWFYWRGISRAMMYAHAGVDMEAPDESTLDFSRVAHIAGVPRYMFKTALGELRQWARAAASRSAVATFEHELWLWFFAGVLRQRWRERHRGPAVSRVASV